MKIDTNKVDRRSFLAGTASLAGVTLLSHPSIASAFGAKPESTTNYTLYFWNGKLFIPTEQIPDPISTAATVRVQISGFGENGHLRAIDVQMGGGIFEAYKSQPQGAQTVSFTTMASEKMGVPLLVRSGSGTKTFHLQVGKSKGSHLAYGTYLLVETGVSVNSYRLDLEQDVPLRTSSGLGAGIPHTLIHIKKA